MKDMRTPLSRVRGLGSAKAGTRDFWIQRLTAAANVPLALLLIAFVVALAGADYATVRSYLGNPLVAIPMLLLVLSGTWHMRIGTLHSLELAGRAALQPNLKLSCRDLPSIGSHHFMPRDAKAYWVW
jgi:succinate dehydrogenase hydrophobic anchor subunit